MSEAQAHPSERVFLSRSAFDAFVQSGSGSGWAHVAGWLGRADDSLLATATVVQAAAVVQSYRDVVSAYAAASPTRMAQLTEGSAALREDSEAVVLLGQGWRGRVGDSAVVTASVLDAVTGNLALTPLEEATGAAAWRASAALCELVAELRALDATLPIPESMPASLTTLLRQPAKQSPHDLAGQLEWIENHWEAWLSDGFRDLRQLSDDVAAEAHTVRMSGPGPAQPAGIDLAAGMGGNTAFGQPGDPGYVDANAAFSDDQDWMPGLVMMAKQTYVWLDQLSRQYGRDIHRLDQIPDEELDALASRGFRGLWLIGLWERSTASRDIKVRCGNPEAAASAYSLKDYAIAHSLGGQEALDRLRDRAWARGIRLAADMVPNHMGLDSTWLVEHPDRFLQLSSPPYPSYTFNGPDLSGDGRVSIYLEDGYWDQRDAAVVFKSIHHDTGQVRYIYHGNDGTQMPWNDTAQLDYLKPDVREAVIQTILGVARQFPVIRFDAAMTLARKHIARLWYPPPGGAGAIPSRAEHTVPAEVLDRLLPGEFWREVVERIRQEVPDTLLLAEAFWMMEGYFVRTLGMHRVYNSAFMHMLRDEDNAGYRGAIKSVLEYSPAILERYVNFMNNPDEETAVEQFGKGDKYFGIATLMSTLPGLPMFGHGQIEGYTEKYGMEFTRAYRDEQPDQGLVDYHDRVIFPIVRERHKFCGVEHFALMDFWRDGTVDENVFAFANRSGRTGEPSLVLYNNAFEPTAGWVLTSTAINVGESDAPERVHRSLGEALGLIDDPNVLYGLWELRHGAWLLRTGAELCQSGLFAELGGYEALVFLDIRVLDDTDGRLLSFAQTEGRGWVADLTAISSVDEDVEPLSEVDQEELDLADETDEHAEIDGEE